MVFYHGTTKENWKKIKEEGFLFGRRYVVDNENVKEISRCTYLAFDKDEASHYGDIVLKVNYNPFDENGNIRKDENGFLNNYVPDGWQLRIYEPIPISNLTEIKI